MSKYIKDLMKGLDGIKNQNNLVEKIFEAKKEQMENEHYENNDEIFKDGINACIQYIRLNKKNEET